MSSAVAPALVAPAIEGPCVESCHAPTKKTMMSSETKPARKLIEIVFTEHQPILLIAKDFKYASGLAGSNSLPMILCLM